MTIQQHQTILWSIVELATPLELLGPSMSGGGLECAASAHSCPRRVPSMPHVPSWDATLTPGGRSPQIRSFSHTKNSSVRSGRPSSDGTLPSNSLDSKRKDLSAESRPSSVGSVPERELFLNHMPTSRVRSPSSEGSVPRSAL
eukprot:CAMPEP_0114284464 /NCGR_PEP_ID=MMETSP0059-20121206/4661_1 /TAXON_ID=36894 /ORGANISM="Pyramimonas parkeae, Strain CCMP726" /LENGTH=142 /DNA_ID=CAMNT_0001405285 /DNA_START=203 /DNA_END=631 /DNA_ORIENTATION=+